MKSLPIDAAVVGIMSTPSPCAASRSTNPPPESCQALRIPMANLNEQTLKRILDDVLAQLSTGGASPGRDGCGCAKNAPPAGPRLPSPRRSTGDGVFEDVNAAAASRAHRVRAAPQGRLRHPPQDRQHRQEDVRRQRGDLGPLEFAETKVGRLEHKIEKLQGIPAMVPGFEWLRALRAERRSTASHWRSTPPFGVIGVDHPRHPLHADASPATSSTMVAAGNALLINPHPNGARCAAEAVRAFNQAIRPRLGIEQPRLHGGSQAHASRSFDQMCRSRAGAAPLRHRRPGRRRRRR
jgi:aldehyde dehydrogenase